MNCNPPREAVNGSKSQFAPSCSHLALIRPHFLTSLPLVSIATLDPPGGAERRGEGQVDRKPLAARIPSARCGLPSRPGRLSRSVRAFLDVHLHGGSRVMKYTRGPQETRLD